MNVLALFAGYAGIELGIELGLKLASKLKVLCDAAGELTEWDSGNFTLDREFLD